MEKRLLTKKSLNILVDAQLLENAKKSGIKFSAVMDKALRKELADNWSKENQDAIKTYNERIEKHGLWSDGFRSW